MDLVSVILIAVGLSMDAFAVAISGSLIYGRIQPSQALKIGAAFGGFQALMPILGWLAGVQLRDLISSIDHWIAFLLLTTIGARMIGQALDNSGKNKTMDILNPRILLALAVATSIDALVVGLSFAFLNTPIVTPALIIGSITFALTLVGVDLGQKFGLYLGKKMEILGGAVLIAIGAKILIQHLFFNG
ncbi:MAG TPA: manganese efflux pump MntP family protein [bacterium]|nr:manganese efflux pump MntP family protein [bacterium]HPN35172.1 manganese efflux pump MntP family protein [bacterium]